jgi:hypothetical protein
MKRLFYCIAWLGIISMMISIIIMFWWSVYPYKPVIFRTEYFETTKTHYKVGELLQYKVDYCKYMNLKVTISRAFIDGIVYLTPDSTGARPIGCGVTGEYMEIPNLPPATYKIKITYTYQVNPIRTISIIKYTNPFTVLENN